jgi:predicted RNA polymerase sigma factor
VRRPKEGLELLDLLQADRQISEHNRIDSVLAHLLEMAGDSRAAERHYRVVASKTVNLPERNYLLMQAARLATAMPRFLNKSRETG